MYYFLLYLLKYLLCRGKTGGGRAMKLGKGPKDVDSFVSQLQSEGQRKLLT